MNPKKRTAGGQLALSRELVLSRETFERETANVFSGRWLYVCRESELDEDSACRRVEVCGHQLILVRGADETTRAFHNFCRHRGSELITEENCGSIRQRIQCPYHAWTYNRNGELVSAPNMTDVNGFDKNEFGLKEVVCELWHGFLFVKFTTEENSDEISLGEFLSPLQQHAVDWSFNDLNVVAEINYDVQANWKLIFQNYSECYHCPTVHPVLNQLTPYKGAGNDIEEGPILGGPMMLADEASTMSIDGVAVGKTLPRLNKEQSRTVSYYTIFPSMFLSAHPDYLLLHRIERVDEKSTRVVCQFLFHEQSRQLADFDPKPAIDFWDLTNRQDWHVCELAQRGIENPAYQPGPYSDLESVVAAFDRYYRSCLDVD
jgi:Rieske 2Fe-2S family protein